MRRWLAVGFLPLIGAATLQDRPDKDILVIGPSLDVRTGEWLFERTATLLIPNGPVSPRSDRGRPSIPGFKYRMCIGEGDMRDAIGMMLGSDPGREGAGTCAPPRLRIANGRIEGGYRCSYMGLRATKTRTVSGLVRAETIDLDIRGSWVSAKGSVLGDRSRLTARRIGECSTKPPAATPPTPTEG